MTDNDKGGKDMESILKWQSEWSPRIPELLADLTQARNWQEQPPNPVTDASVLPLIQRATIAALALRSFR